MQKVRIQKTNQTNQLISNDSDVSKARNAAYKMLSYRSMSVYEVEEKLKKKGFSIGTIGVTVKKLQELHLVNDEKYANDIARSMATLKGYGRYVITRKLQEKGIDRCLVDKAVEKIYEETGEAEFASRLVLKKTRGAQLRFEDKGRIWRYLQYKGYSSAIIKEVLKDIE